MSFLCLRWVSARYASLLGLARQPGLGSRPLQRGAVPNRRACEEPLGLAVRFPELGLQTRVELEQLSDLRGLGVLRVVRYPTALG